MLTVSLWFPHNAQQHGCGLQQQICVNQSGDQNIPLSYSWKYPLSVSLTLTLLSTYIMRSIHSIMMHFVCIFEGVDVFQKIQFILRWKPGWREAASLSFQVFPCLLCCGKNRSKHQSGHLVYSSSPQGLVFFRGPLWSPSHICWVLHLLPAAVRAHLLDKVQSHRWLNRGLYAS